MHAAAHDYAAQFATDDKITVIDVGSRDINGTVRALFPNAKYTGVDIVDGNGVDVAADAAVWAPKKPVDLVVCLEMLEHCAVWRDVIRNIHDTMLKSSGRIVVTAANLSRAPHSGVDGGQVRPDEFYENIDPVDLENVLIDAGFWDVVVEELGTDVRATGVKDTDVLD